MSLSLNKTRSQQKPAAGSRKGTALAGAKPRKRSGNGAELPKLKPLTPNEVAILIEEVVALAEFDDAACAILVSIADAFIASFNDCTRVEDLAAAIRGRAYAMTAHNNRSCDAYATEARETLEVALANIRARK
jgi:hypothetical protein